MKPILIVEDHERNLKLLREVLRARGYATVEARTGHEGLQRARDHSPPLILLDIQLPDIDGFQVLGMLRADPATRDIAIVAVSASAMPDDRERIMRSGFDGYITKPVGLTELFATVSKFVAPPPGDPQ